VSTERLRRTIGSVHARRLGERALEAGLVTAEQLAEALAALEGGGASLQQILLERGWVARADFARLEQDLVGDDLARLTAQRLTPPPPEAIAVEGDATRQLAEFLLVERIGQGGAAEVLKAWDRSLGRWVAIKRPLTAFDTSAARERFQREALAVARLSHPHIVPVFRVGEADGRPYLVMPYIEGTTLAHRPPASIRAALEVMRTAALAVQHAHQQGVVHRDLKPGNIILDKDGRVFILDFGLGYLLAQETPRITQPGDVMGTPAYMSPEQARGDAAARAPGTDVYGLGATLYFLLTGRAPFEGESFAELVGKVIRDEPVAPRRLRPDLPRDVQTVLLKAMDKDPRRRYASAGDLAEDLRRVLETEAINARSISLPARVVRRVRRHAVASLAAAATLAVVVVVAVAWRRLHNERSAAADAIRETARMSLQTALRLRRAGDYAGMLQTLPQLTSAYERAVARVPRMAEADYLMGRMYRALMQDQRALGFQERALGKDPGYVPALYERALLRSKLYGKDFTRGYKLADRLKAAAVSSTSVRASAPPERSDIEGQNPQLAPARELVMADLGRLQALRPGSTDALAASGIQAYYEWRLDDARRELQKVVARDPDRDEGWEYLGLVAVRDRRLEDAERAFGDGLARDRGYLPYLERRCRVRIDRRDFAGAIADGSQLSAIQPDNVEGLACRATARALLAEEHAHQDRDSTAEFAAASADCQQAVRAAPERMDPWLACGIVRRLIASSRGRAGEDPGPEFAAAEDMFSRALAIDPGHPSPWRGRGRTRSLRALHAIEHGGDPGDDLRAADADLTEAIRRDPRGWLGWCWRGELAAQRAHHRAEHGQTADDDFAAADDDFAESLRLRPSDEALAGRGRMRAWSGRARARAGGDPLPSWSAAEEDLAAAIARNGGAAAYREWRETLRAERAAWLRSRHRAGH
jgi:tetratricopeptide (TPR) repeat protein